MVCFIYSSIYWKQAEKITFFKEYIHLKQNSLNFDVSVFQGFTALRFHRFTILAYQGFSASPFQNFRSSVF